MELCLNLKIKKEEIPKLADQITALLYGGIYNIDLFIENHWELSDGDLEIYQEQLTAIAGMICFIKEIKRENVCLNVLTDIFSPGEAKDESLTMCKDCPCTHCRPDKTAFKEFTGFENIPFRDYCKKPFKELAVSGVLLGQLVRQPVEWTDLDEADWFELQLLKGAQYAIQDQDEQSNMEV